MGRVSLAILWIATSLLQLPTGQTPIGGVPVPPKAIISGTVLHASTGEPIARAQVTLVRVSVPASAPTTSQQQQQREAPPLIIPSVTTDDQGKFQILDIDAGTYRVAAARNGFVRQEYGQRSLNRAGAILNITPGQQLQDVGFRLTPAGTISGRVVNAAGDPQPGINVQALRSSYDAAGNRTLQPVQTARTNDLGEYRLYWMNPGRYYVTANAAKSGFEALTSGLSQMASQSSTAQDAQAAAQVSALYGPPPPANEVTDPGLLQTYYPGTPDVSRAIVMELLAGAELRAIDFTLVRGQKVRIRGRLTLAATGRPPQRATVSVMTRATSGTSLLDSLIGGQIGGMLQGNSFDPATGNFEVREVAPGSYWLQIQAPNPVPAGARAAAPTNASTLIEQASAATIRMQIPVEVSVSDLDNLNVTLTSGVPMQGRVVIEGAQASNPNALARLSVSLGSGPLDNPVLSAILGGGAARLAADGSFTIARVLPGAYQLTITGMDPDTYIKSARLGRTEVLQGVTIGDSVSDTLEVTLSSSSGQLDGILTDAGLKPLTGAQAVLIPDQLRDRRDLYKTAVTSTDGRFTIRGIPPGDYRIFAWEDLEPFSYFDPDVLKTYEQRGTLVHIQPSSKETVDLKIIPATQ